MSDNTDGDAGVHEDDLKESNTEFGRGRDLFFFRMSSYQTNFLIKKNSVALVRERTIPTERPPPVGEVSANFCG